VLLYEHAVRRAEAGQGAGQRARSDGFGRDPVGLPFVPPHEHERVGVEVGHVPLEEAPEETRAPAPTLLERRQELEPGRPDPVDPDAEAPVRIREVAELVRDHGLELFR
jgi:hypothetical protein